MPRFRANDFFGGIREAIERMIALVEGEPLPEPERAQRGAPDGLGNALPLLLMLVFVGSGILRGMLGRFGGASVTAGIAAVIVWVLTSTLVIAIGAAVIAFVVACSAAEAAVLGSPGRAAAADRRRLEAAASAAVLGWRAAGWSGGGALGGAEIRRW